MNDSDYFARRAEQEALLAQKAKTAAAVDAHARMSSAYLDLAQHECALPPAAESPPRD